MDLTRFRDLWPLAEKKGWNLEDTNMRDPETNKPILMVNVPETALCHAWAACWTRLEAEKEFILVPHWYEEQLIEII